MRIQNKLKMVLSSILLPQHPEREAFFPELMTLIHDLRTLNTLHTEKFLQQCKINEHVPTASAVSAAASSAASPPPGTPGTPPGSMDGSGNFEATPSHQRWDSGQMDRDSTGNGSPQSSTGGDTHSSTSLEDTSSRRSPMGSVSSTDSSSSEVCKLLTNVQDLRMSNNNSSSVLMTALTSNGLPSGMNPMGGLMAPRKPTSSSASSVASSVASTPSSKRKTDSPGTDSGVEMSLKPSTNSHSSFCSSSPRSSPEAMEIKRSTASPPSASLAVTSRESEALHGGGEERHPLLKRALQQPPMQLFNGAGNASSVATFQVIFISYP